MTPPHPNPLPQREREKGGAPVATNKEQRPSEERERRGREMVSAPERCSDE